MEEPVEPGPQTNESASDTDSLLVAALGAVDLGLQAAVAYDRADLRDRVAGAREGLTSPEIRVVVAGEFKQGKSSFVNALVGLNVCPVDDDLATSVPTVLRFGETPEVTAVHRLAADAPEGADPIREAVALGAVADWVSEAGNPGNTRGTSRVEICIPRRVLADGLELVDTPGTGSLGSAEAVATLAQLSSADAVLFVSDASQELSGLELDFLRSAVERCPRVVALLSKTDLYPQSRHILDIDRGHLARAGLDIPMLPISSRLRQIALKREDQALNERSGFQAIVALLRETIVPDGSRASVRSAARAVLWEVAQLDASFRAEQAVLSDPAGLAATIAVLEGARVRAERLRGAAARWQTTLADGIADLTADLDFDLRDRIRAVTAEADETIEQHDPDKVWSEFGPWLASRAAAAVGSHFALLDDRLATLASTVADLFNDEAEKATPYAFEVPTDRLAQLELSELEVHRGPRGERGLASVRAGQSGISLAGALGHIGGLVLAMPATVVIGVLMGARALREERHKHLQQRRQQAKSSARRYLDDVSLHAGKASRDSLRMAQRHVRDHFQSQAESLLRTANEALTAAQQAAQGGEEQRGARLRQVGLELQRVAGLGEQAQALLAAVSP
ncbi:MAG: dynamin family protein [Acidimicrobiales bacterium]